MRELTLKYPLLQATVSEQGIIEVILEGSDSNYVQVYGKNGKLNCGHALIYRGKRLSDYSSDFSEWNTACGKLLFYQWKYFQKHLLQFYDLSRQLQSDSIPLKGGFDYTNTIIPKVSIYG